MSALDYINVAYEELNHPPMTIPREPDSSEPAPRRGKFIVFDGVDGSGKGTQVKMLHALLLDAGLDVMITKVPGGSPVGDEIRKILFETIKTPNIAPDALELLFLANHMENAYHVSQALSRGTWVIADRWSPSGLAYMEMRGASDRMRRWYASVLYEIPWDLFFFMSGNVDTLIARAQARTTEQHQAAKKWNSAGHMLSVKRAFEHYFGAQPQTIRVQSHVGTPTEIMLAQILPAMKKIGFVPSEDRVLEVLNAVQ